MQKQVTVTGSEETLEKQKNMLILKDNILVTVSPLILQRVLLGWQSSYVSNNVSHKTNRLKMLAYNMKFSAVTMYIIPGGALK
jgi:hypothetical protein